MTILKPPQDRRFQRSGTILHVSRLYPLKAIIERYKVNSKPSRDWTKFNQLIEELERELALEAKPLA
jgi:hypothetical protein